MPTPYFLADALQSAWQRDLEYAHSSALITLAQAAWLGQPDTAQNLRVDRIDGTEGPVPEVLAGALMFSHPNDASDAVYLHTPLFGLERFISRAALNEALNARCLNGPFSFELTHVQADRHLHRMQSIIDARVARLTLQADELHQQPAIASTATVSDSEAQVSRYWTPARQALTSVLLQDNFCRTLLQATHDQSVTPQEMRWLRTAVFAPHDARRTCRPSKLSVSAGTQDPVKLAVVVVLEKPDTADAPLFVHVPGEPLHRCADRTALAKWLDGLKERTSLPEFLSSNDQALFSTLGTLTVRVDGITQPLFQERVRSLIGLHKRNVEHALTDNPPDNALALPDIANLIDPALGAYRRHTYTVPAQPLPSDLWIDRMHAMERQHQALCDRQPTLAQCARESVGRYLAAIDPRFSALTQLSVSTRLLDALGAKPPADAHGTLLPLALQAHIEQVCRRDLRSVYRHERQRANTDQRSTLLETRQQILRLTLAVERRKGLIEAGRLDWLEQVLDRPEPDQRIELGVARCDVHGLQVVLKDTRARFDWADALVIHPAAQPSGPVLFWSAQSGLATAQSLTALMTSLADDLNSRRRDDWLASLAPNARRTVDRVLRSQSPDALKVQTRAVEHPLWIDLQGLAEQHLGDAVSEAWQRCATLAINGDALASYIDQAGADAGLATAIDTLDRQLRNQLLTEWLPDWLKKASSEQLTGYLNVLQQLALHSTGKDYLFGIEPLKEFARQKLMARLRRFDLKNTPDPDTLQVTLQAFIVAPGGIGEVPSSVPAATLTQTSSLTEFALIHYAKTRGSALKIRQANGDPVPAWLTPNLVRTLAHELDIGGAYQALLASRFSTSDAHYVERQRLFIEQIPSVLRERAFEARLNSQLSDVAWAFVDAVLDMPDGLARLPVRGHNVLLRPLQLIAQAEMSADPVTGVYLIGPLSGGPLVVFAASHKDFVYREFKDQEDFLASLRKETGLQRLVLSRVDDQAAVRYGHGGFTEPHLPFSTESTFDLPWSHPAPAGVSSDSVQSNALTFLFEDHLRLLQWQAKAQSVTRQQADWAALLYLMGLGLEQGSLLLPGKFAALIGLWQSTALLQESIKAANRQSWGEALSEFCSALSTLISARPLPVHRPADVTAEQSSNHRSGWSHGPLTPELRHGLAEFEAPVALADLHRDPLLNLYDTPDGAHRYAPVGGRVYEVSHGEGTWHIIKEGEPGPVIRLSPLGQWEIELTAGLRGGGAALSTRLNTDVTDTLVDNLMQVHARGLPAIRLHNRHQARLIGQAHLYAKRSLETCLDNLNLQNPATPLAPAVTQIIGDCFGMASPSPALVGKVRTVAVKLFNELLDSTLSPFSSPRFVTGTSRPGHEHQVAFVVKRDPQRRIFLTQLYFDVPARIRHQQDRLLAPFDALAHSRASGLIHELSHLIHDTVDIDYLESPAPFPDLINPNDPHDPYLKSDIERIRLYRLSVNTPRSLLFKRERGNQWTDLGKRTGDADAKKAILRIAAKSTLDEARDVFFNDPDKRADIILANADSVTVLLMTLGRQLLTTP